jgi:hypothetical protein
LENNYRFLSKKEKLKEKKEAKRQIIRGSLAQDSELFEELIDRDQ